MRLRVTVYLRPKTVKVLLARKDKAWGGQKLLADHLGISEQCVSDMLAGKMPVPTGRQGAIINLFRGMGHGRGERVTWDHLFQSVVRDTSMSGTAA